MTPDPATPLTPEEEADVRRRAEAHVLVVGPDAWAGYYLRLQATLDAARTPATCECGLPNAAHAGSGMVVASSAATAALNGYQRDAATSDERGLTVAEMSPWSEAECQQRCGWSGTPDLAVAHVRETGHEVALTTHRSTHYRRAS